MNSDLFARNSAELQVFRAEICAEICAEFCAEFCAENSAEFCTEICVEFRTDFHSEIPGFIAKVQIFITFYSFFAFFIMVFTMEIRSEICIFFRNSDAEFRMRNSVRKTPPVYAEILTKTADFRCGIHTSCGFPLRFCGIHQQNACGIPHSWSI